MFFGGGTTPPPYPSLTRCPFLKHGLTFKIVCAILEQSNRMHLLFQNRRGTLPLKKLSTKVDQKKMDLDIFGFLKMSKNGFY